MNGDRNWRKRRDFDTIFDEGHPNRLFIIVVILFSLQVYQKDYRLDTFLLFRTISLVSLVFL